MKILFDSHVYETTSEVANGNDIITVLTESGEHLDTITLDHEFEMAVDSYGDVFANYYGLCDLSEGDRLTEVTMLVASREY
jgi:hypothetical protein